MSEEQARESAAGIREASAPVFQPPRFLAKPWVLFVLMALGCVAPLVFLNHKLKISWDVFFYFLGCLSSLLLLRWTLLAFDPGSFPPWPRQLGYLLKALAIANALCALRLGAAILNEEDELLGASRIVWLEVLAVTVLWAQSVLDYLVGDVQIRLSRQGHEAEESKGQA